MAMDMHKKIFHYELCDIKYLKLNTFHYLLKPKSNLLSYQAGQYCKLIDDDGIARFFSIANAPSKCGIIELLIRKTSANTCLLERLNLKKEIVISGPYGNNCYKKEFDGPIIFLAYGMGIAPIKAILEQSIIEKDKRPLFLFWIMKKELNAFFQNQLNSWNNDLSNFKYFILSEGEKSLCDTIKISNLNVEESLVYASGPYDKIKSDLQLFKNFGLYNKNIYSDVIDLYE